nr:MAG TPA: hypothetical protein [Caudoviricetes sp.]
MLSVKHSKLLHKVVVSVVMFRLAHRRHNRLWLVLLIWLVWRIQRTHKIHTHQDSSLHSHKGIVRIYHFEIRCKVEMIKQAFNAVEI